MPQASREVRVGERECGEGSGYRGVIHTLEKGDGIDCSRSGWDDELAEDVLVWWLERTSG